MSPICVGDNAKPLAFDAEIDCRTFPLPVLLVAAKNLHELERRWFFGVDNRLPIGDRDEVRPCSSTPGGFEIGFDASGRAVSVDIPVSQLFYDDVFFESDAIPVWGIPQGLRFDMSYWPQNDSPFQVRRVRSSLSMHIRGMHVTLRWLQSDLNFSRIGECIDFGLSESGELGAVLYRFASQQEQVKFAQISRSF